MLGHKWGWFPYTFTMIPEKNRVRSWSILYPDLWIISHTTPIISQMIPLYFPIKPPFITINHHSRSLKYSYFPWYLGQLQYFPIHLTQLLVIFWIFPWNYRIFMDFSKKITINHHINYPISRTILWWVRHRRPSPTVGAFGPRLLCSSRRLLQKVDAQRGKFH